MSHYERREGPPRDVTRAASTAADARCRVATRDVHHPSRYCPRPIASITLSTPFSCTITSTACAHYSLSLYIVTAIAAQQLAASERLIRRLNRSTSLLCANRTAREIHELGAVGDENLGVKARLLNCSEMGVSEGAETGARTEELREALLVITERAQYLFEALGHDCAVFEALLVHRRGDLNGDALVGRLGGDADGHRGRRWRRHDRHHHRGRYNRRGWQRAGCNGEVYGGLWIGRVEAAARNEACMRVHTYFDIGMSWAAMRGASGGADEADAFAASFLGLGSTAAGRARRLISGNFSTLRRGELRSRIGRPRSSGELEGLNETEGALRHLLVGCSEGRSWDDRLGSRGERHRWGLNHRVLGSMLRFYGR